MRVFLDTNVLASALLGHGLCRDLFDRLVVERRTLIGEPVVRELSQILIDRFRVPTALCDELFEKLGRLTRAPSVAMELTEITDPDDVPIVACAIGAKADAFVTGDKALLQLSVVKGMPILSSRQARHRLFPIANP